MVPKERVSGCMRWPTGADVQVLYSPEQRKAAFSGLQTCGSVWLCPVCSGRISEQRRAELGSAIAAAKDLGQSCVVATFTVSHQRADDLGRTLEGLNGARKRMRSGRAGVQLRDRWGVLGSVRSLEVTHGGKE